MTKGAGNRNLRKSISHPGLFLKTERRCNGKDKHFWIWAVVTTVDWVIKELYSFLKIWIMNRAMTIPIDTHQWLYFAEWLNMQYDYCWRAPSDRINKIINRWIRKFYHKWWFWALPLPDCFWWGIMCLRRMNIVILWNPIIRLTINLCLIVVAEVLSYVVQLHQEHRDVQNTHVFVDVFS